MKKAEHASDILEALSLQELCRFCQADEEWVVELVQYGVLEPVGSSSDNWHFRGRSIVRAKKAQRLSRDLGINVAGIALVLELIEQRDLARRALARLNAL
ncbi:chaperone modulator CbpM [Tateyamaria sp. SN3-11]|uniref:chaperone modulator CbpM n=1 Tax=Tateyamaria sp. SN3-11 TaxID=3092147 RepID=UPI0039ED4542